MRRRSAGDPRFERRITDAAISINNDGVVKAVHLAGAGNMVSLLIQTELGRLFLAGRKLKTLAQKWREPVRHSPRERRGGFS